MSKTDELLNSLTEEQIAAYSNGSAEKEHIVIQANRQPKVPESLKHIAVQHDNNVTTVTFDCPRYWDELDMSKMVIHINYMREDGVMGMSPVENVTIDSVKPEIMHFDWLITKHVTEVKGTLSFLVCIKKDDAEGNSVNHWNSELNKEMYVTEGLECDSSIYALYPDIVTYMLIRMSEITQECVETYQRENPLQVDKTLTKQGFAADAAVVGNKIASTNEQVEFVKGYTKPMNQYVWRKTTPNYRYELKSEEQAKVIGVTNNSMTADNTFMLKTPFTVWYTDSFSIDEKTGKCTTGTVSSVLVDRFVWVPTGEINPSNGSLIHVTKLPDEITAALTNKYLAFRSNGFETAEFVYYATSITGKNSDMYNPGHIDLTGRVIRKNAVLIGSAKTTYLYANTPTAYPIGKTSDGSMYEYLGPFNSVTHTMNRSQTISYMGNGKWGANNPTILKFDFAPMTLTMLGRASVAFPDTDLSYIVFGHADENETFHTGVGEYHSWSYNGRVFSLDLLDTHYQLFHGVFDDGDYLYMKKSEDGKTIYMYSIPLIINLNELYLYSGDHAMIQANGSGVTYYIKAEG